MSGAGTAGMTTVVSTAGAAGATTVTGTGGMPSGGTATAAAGMMNPSTGGTTPATGGMPGAAGQATGGMSTGGTPGATAGMPGAAGGGSGSPITCTPGTDGNGTINEPGPNYPPAPESMAPAAQGQLISGQYTSQLYNGDVFPYQIYVPSQYNANTPAALMVYQDGSRYLGQVEGLFYAQNVMENLIAAGEMPVAIGLFLDTPAGGEAKRQEVYDSPMDTYPRFLVEEVIPDVILNDYNIIMDPEAWVAVGFSAGGSQGLAALLYQNDYFHKNIGTNSSFLAIKANGVDYIDVVNALPATAVLRVSLLSSPNDLNDQRGDWLTGNRDMFNALQAKGYDVRMVEGVGMHYPPDHGSQDLPDAMRWMWQGCVVQ